jgi:hypothetical protein
MSHPWQTREERDQLAVACRRIPQWRVMAEQLAELKRPIDAYKAAGFVPHRGNAHRLARQPEVQAYAQELMDDAAEFAGVSRVKVVNRIDRVGRANVADFYEDDGRTLRNIKELPRELTDALAELDFRFSGNDEEGNPRYVAEIKLHDKNAANLALLRYLGAIPEDPAGSQTTNIFNLLNVDDQRALAEALEALPRGPARIGGPPAGERREA